MSEVASTLSSRQGKSGGCYYRQDFDVILLFGLTELKAQISWMEKVNYFLTSSSIELMNFISPRSQGKEQR
jgi:hypothetical protein